MTNNIYIYLCDLLTTILIYVIHGGICLFCVSDFPNSYYQHEHIGVESPNIRYIVDTSEETRL